MSEWISVEDESPLDGECVLVYRPQVLTKDYTDKPIRMSTFRNDRFDCYHKPKMWMRIQKPDDWCHDLENRQAK